MVPVDVLDRRMGRDKYHTGVSTPLRRNHADPGNLLQFIISVIALPAAARYLERVWGPRELIRFSIIVIVASNIIAFGLSWIEFIVLGHPEVFL